MSHAETVRNTSMILDGFIERSVLCVTCNKYNFAYFHFSNYLPVSIFFNSFSEHISAAS